MFVGSKDLPPSVRVNVVLCEEVNVPEGEDPICWMLVSNLLTHLRCIRQQSMPAGGQWQTKRGECRASAAHRAHEQQ
ncbi:hypothetical protein [Novipirellula artificiosorum]|uniref:hypothetical protein n=1 Tax=Novipirellula artificiosorum TaxID=2528016 RepID=UPI0011B64AC9|nr:hypothetical protein [Novipirellula artificiosorum]